MRTSYSGKGQALAHENARQRSRAREIFILRRFWVGPVALPRRVEVLPRSQRSLRRRSPLRASAPGGQAPSL